jgi:hypothetical protein
MKGTNTLCGAVFLLAMADGLIAGEAAVEPLLPMQDGSTGRIILPMDAEEPMPIGMKREGMKKGDVRYAAEQKKQYLEEMMEQEAHVQRRGNSQQ